MKPKSSRSKKPAEQVVKDIRRRTRRHFSAEDKIRIVLEGLRGDDSIAELCRRGNLRLGRPNFITGEGGRSRLLSMRCYCLADSG
jgi:hypothetical protein